MCYAFCELKIQPASKGASIALTVLPYVPSLLINLVHQFGSPTECVERLRDLKMARVQNMIIRFPSYDQKRQLNRFLTDVAPRL